MNTTIRRVGIGMLVLFLGLVAQLTYLQIVRADDLKNDPNNVRVFLRDYSRPRGLILTADGTSSPSRCRRPTTSSRSACIRPRPRSCSRTSSATSRSTSATPASRRSTTTQLVGRDFDIAIDDLSDFFSGKDTRGNVVLTMAQKAQQARGRRARRAGAARSSCST